MVAADGLKFVNNGYEDLRVVIMDSVVENDQIIERIKVIIVMGKQNLNNTSA